MQESGLGSDWSYNNNRALVRRTTFVQHCFSKIHSRSSHTHSPDTISIMGGPESTEVSNTRPRDSFDTQSDATSADLEDIGPDGLGAKRAEIVAQHMTRAERRTILICLFIFGFAYGLENMLRVVYQV